MPAWPLAPEKSISQYLHSEWGPDKGLAGGQVYAIAQSQDGYLWIGTARGLVRFDGFNFVLMQQLIPDIPGVGPIRGLLADGSGNLWIRIDGRHLLRYRGGKFEDILAHQNVQIADITAMSIDRDGELILAGLSENIFRFHDGHFDPIVKASETPGTILALAQSRDGAIWVATRDAGLYRFSRGHVTHVPGKLGQTKINALLEAANGGVWVGTDDGLFELDSNGHLSTQLSHAFDRIEILALTRDLEGNLWAGTSRGLVRITRDFRVSFASTGPAADTVTSVYRDRDGDIWYGGSQGIERLRDGPFTAWSVADGLPSKNNGAIYVDSKGRTWFAPLSGGLYWLLDGHVTRITHDGLDRDVVYSISGGKNEVWVGRQYGGLTELIDDGAGIRSKSFTVADGLPQNVVYAVHRNRDGTVWAATASAGVVRVKDGRPSSLSSPPALSPTAVNSIVEGQDGTMWFATSSGLASFSNGNWANRTAQDGLPSSYIQAIFQDSKLTLWIATSTGLAFLSSGQLKVASHLPDVLREQIFAIQEDGEGDIWFVTSDHVVRANRDEMMDGKLREADLQTYGVADGLPGTQGVRRERSMVSDSLGRVWISLDQGLAMFNPSPTLADPSTTGVRLDSISADGVELNPFNLQPLAPGTRSVALHFSSTNLSDPSRIRFRYSLDGSDRGWSEIVDLREVIYRNLGPGNYRFRVVASSPEGLWNGPETIVPFVIDRPFWQTWWFNASCFVFSVLTVFFLYRLRMYSLTQRLNSRFQERLSERTRIAQELHDTLLQSFQGLMLRFQIVDQLLLTNPDDAREALEGALDRADQALSESRDAIQGIRSPSSASRDLAQALNELVEELREETLFAKTTKPTTSVIVEGQVRTLNAWITEEVRRIAREALINAFCHASAQLVEVEIAYSKRFLRLRFRDDGVGIDPAVLRKGGRAGHWGLTGMSERAANLHSRLSIWSKPSAGTEVELTIPAYIAFEAPLSRGWFGKYRRKVRSIYDGRS